MLIRLFLPLIVLFCLAAPTSADAVDPPQDQDHFWLTFYAGQQDFDQLRATMANTDLQNLAKQCRVKTIDTASAMYKQWWAVYHPDTPAMVLQDADGAVVYKLAGAAWPDPVEIVDEIEAKLTEYAGAGNIQRPGIVTPKSIPSIRPNREPLNIFGSFRALRGGIALVITAFGCVLAFRIAKGE